AINPNSKNYYRYCIGPDVTGLFIGSLGSFGIITNASLKVYKRAKHYHYNTYGFQNAEQMEDFILEVKKNDVNTLWIANYEGRILEFFLDMAGEEYGIPEYKWPQFTVSMTIGSTRKDHVQSDAALVKSICERKGGNVVGIPELPQSEWEDRLRKWVRLSYLHGWHWRILYHHQPITNWHKSVKVIWEVLDEFGIIGHTAGLQSGHGSYNFYPQLYYDPQDPEEEQRVREAHKELAKRLAKTGAVPFKLAPYWSDVEEMKDYLEFVKKLKQTIDPDGILNPGVLGGI
ncbi:MAG: FAD-binding oxidoreductase, partial [Candidatus Hodarchaeota archaeon]